MNPNKPFKTGNIVSITDNRWANVIGRLAKVKEATYNAGYCNTVSLISEVGEVFLFSTKKIRLANPLEVNHWRNVTESQEAKEKISW